MLTSSAVPWDTKLDQVVYLFGHVPFGLPLLAVKAETAWLYFLAVSANALLVAGLLRRWLKRRQWQWYGLAGVGAADAVLWLW